MHGRSDIQVIGEAELTVQKASTLKLLAESETGRPHFRVIKADLRLLRRAECPSDLVDARTYRMPAMLGAFEELWFDEGAPAQRACSTTSSISHVMPVRPLQSSSIRIARSLCAEPVAVCATPSPTKRPITCTLQFGTRRRMYLIRMSGNEWKLMLIMVQPRRVVLKAATCVPAPVEGVCGRQRHEGQI